eukprot:8742081-Prorocentrum_lima.AAC.1
MHRLQADRALLHFFLWGSYTGVLLIPWGQFLVAPPDNGSHNLLQVRLGSSASDPVFLVARLQ